jgi:hypothetical protein
MKRGDTIGGARHLEGREWRRRNKTSKGADGEAEDQGDTERVGRRGGEKNEREEEEVMTVEDKNTRDEEGCK